MSDGLLYLSNAAVESVALDPGEIVDAVARAFAAKAGGGARIGAKAVVPVGTGHSFHTMLGTLAEAGLAGMKWFGVVPDNPSRGLPNVASVIVLSDIATGLPVAILDGTWITALRTAAMSAVAARHLAHPEAETAAFVGCGVQAHSHATMLRHVLPRLRRATVLGRSAERRDGFAGVLRDSGWEVRLAEGINDVLADADIAVTTVPEMPGGAPFLDAALLPAPAFVAAVDLGRSWLPSSYKAFALVATDDVEQSRALVAQGRLKSPPDFAADLPSLASGAYTGGVPDGRVFFVFSGHVLGDLALAAALYRRARERGLGVELPR